MNEADPATRILAGDPTLFRGSSAAHALGWLGHPERYLGGWLDEVDAQLPRRHARTLLVGMGGSSSPARLYVEARDDHSLVVLDTSNPDTVAATAFSGATVIASSKSGTTVETQTLLAHALAHGLAPADLVVVSDPGSSLVELAHSLGAVVVEGDPDTGGRFSGLSPFGLVPALYAGWTPGQLREELAAGALDRALVDEALADVAARRPEIDDGVGVLRLDGDPIISGGALWLEQLVAETTGKEGRGVIPLAGEGAARVPPARIQHWHLVAALLARDLGVDPFNQPDVESAKRNVFALLSAPVPTEAPPVVPAALRAAMRTARYCVLQAYAPLDSARALADLRRGVEATYGPTTANFGPRYLHSTGQLHKGGPRDLVALQIVVRPRSRPRRIEGRHYTFHDLHRAQALSDLRAMNDAGRRAFQIVVEDFAEAAQLLEVAS